MSKKRKFKCFTRGYKVMDVKEGDNGFQALVLQKDNEVVICFRGTEKGDKKDLKNDLNMIRRNIPSQAKNAISLYDEYKREYPNCIITVIGHSLGGSLAQIVGALRHVTTVTFNAFGTCDILEKNTFLRLSSNKITNYCNPEDYITCINASNHIGRCYEIQTIPVEGKGAHHLECMDSLENRMPVTGEELDTQYRIQQKLKQEFEHYLKTGERMSITMPSLGMHSDNCTGSYYVQGYLREDGTKVSGYTRTCGAKHWNI